MDVRLTQALRGYNAAKSPDLSTGEQGGSMLGQAARDFTETLAGSEAATAQALTGDADPHSLVEALAKTQLAVETAVTVRDRVVEAYQEILRMPV